MDRVFPADGLANHPPFYFMKKQIVGFLLGIIAIVCMANVIKQTHSIYIENAASGNEVKFKVRADDQSVNWVEFNRYGTNVFAIPTNGILPVANGGTGGASASDGKTALGVQSGTATTATDGTVTNTFGTAFSAIPIVTVTQVGSLTATVTNWLVSVTPTNFVLNSGAPGRSNMWIAVGAP